MRRVTNQKYYFWKQRSKYFNEMNAIVEIPRENAVYAFLKRDEIDSRCTKYAL